MSPLPLAPNGEPKCPTCGCWNPPPVELHTGAVLCYICTPEEYTNWSTTARLASAPHRLLPPRRGIKMRVAGKMSPACRTMVSHQEGVCACCGVPGWGSRKGKPLKVGIVVKSKRGTKVMGMFCNSCAAVFRRVRIKMTRRCGAKRGPRSDGPRDQGGSR